MGLSRRRYSRNPNMKAGESWARLPRIHQCQRKGIFRKCRKEPAGTWTAQGGMPMGTRNGEDHVPSATHNFRRKVLGTDDDLGNQHLIKESSTSGRVGRGTKKEGGWKPFCLPSSTMKNLPIQRKRTKDEAVRALKYLFRDLRKMIKSFGLRKGIQGWSNRISHKRKVS